MCVFVCEILGMHNSNFRIMIDYRISVECILYMYTHTIEDISKNGNIR